MSLLESVEVLRKVIDLLPVGVWIVDERGKIVYRNVAGRRIGNSGRMDGGPDAISHHRAWWAASGAGSSFCVGA